MAEERKNAKGHLVHMTDRNAIQISGVTDVLSFDEEGVAVDTVCGMLLLKGMGLHVGRLNLEEGEIAVEGQIDAVTYTDGVEQGKQSLFGRLFR